MRNTNIESMNNEAAQNAIICSDCGRVIENDDYEIVDNEYVCRECLDTYYVFCTCCGENVLADDAYYAEAYNVFVCEECLDSDNIYRRCERCGEIILTRDLYDVHTSDGDELWCHNCVQALAYECDECGDLFDANSILALDGEYLCNDCAETRGLLNPSVQGHCDIRDWVIPNYIMPYSWKPVPCFLPYFDESTIYIGFELEAEYHGDNSCRDIDSDARKVNEMLGFTYAKKDCSLSDKSFELVSHPATFEWLTENQQKISDAIEYLRKAGYTSHDNGRCGLHFHVSLAPMLAKNEAAVNNLLLLINNHWNNLVKLSRRRGDQLVRWAARNYLPVEDETDRDLWKKTKRNSTRYVALNLDNDHTVELRMMRGTLLPQTFFATLQLVHRLVEVALDTAQEAVRSISWEEIVSCDYDELRAYVAKRIRSNSDEEDITESDAIPCLTLVSMHASNLLYRFAYRRLDNKMYYVTSLKSRNTCLTQCDDDDHISTIYCNELECRPNEFFRPKDYIMFEDSGEVFFIKDIIRGCDSDCDSDMFLLFPLEMNENGRFFRCDRRNIFYHTDLVSHNTMLI